MVHKYCLGILGAGNMAYAILSGALKKGVLKASEILVSDVSERALSRFKELDSNITVTTNNEQILKTAKVVLFSIKPQTFYEIKDEIAGKLSASLVLSIMAGVKTEDLKAVAEKSDIIRVMPNTPAQVGMGLSVLTQSDNKEHMKFAKDLFGAVGDTVVLPESDFDAVTAISGSGPAYVYYIMKAIKDTAISLGLNEKDSEKLVLSVFRGASELAKINEMKLDELIAAVKSRGGTTEAMIDSFDKNGLKDVLASGIKKAAVRSRELSEGGGKN